MADSIRARMAAAEAALRAVGLSPDQARVDADVLARHVLGWDRATLLLRRETPMPPDAARVYDQLVARRARREPVAYLTGTREFYGRPFRVSPAVLVPRPETELVVDQVLRRTGSGAPLRVADVGTGSGILAVTIACERPRAHVVAIDISAEALAVARENTRAHEVAARVACVRGDLLESLSGPFDVIVANPPYVPERDAPGLAPDVRDHEPALALFGGDDGLAVIRRLARQAAARLVPAGLFVMEFGAGQGYDVAHHVSDAGFEAVDVLEDLQGIDRVVAGRLRAAP
jgi:release factor glutamine methyltransferase